MKKLLLTLFIVFGAVIVHAQYSPYGVTVAGAGLTSVNQVYKPYGVFVDSIGNLYVGDGTGSIKKWAPGDTSGTVVAGGNGLGAASNQLSSQLGVFVDDTGNIFISDYDNNRVQKWAPGGSTAITVAGDYRGYFGTGPAQLSGAAGVVVDKSGNIFISDQGNERVQKFLPNVYVGTTVAGGNGTGSTSYYLRTGHGICLDRSGNVYVADWGNNRVQKYLPGATNGITVAGDSNGYSNYGSALNLLFEPSGVFVDDTGNIYVAEEGNNRIQKWAPGALSGTTIIGGNGAGSASNQLDHPQGVFVDKAGNVFVADYSNHRVQKFANQYINILTVFDTSYRPLQHISIDYSVYKPFNTNNSFTLQLSDKAGDFSNAINLGSIIDSVSGTFNFQLPAILAAGCNYRFRIISSSPVVYGYEVSSFKVSDISTPPNNYALKFNGTSSKTDLGTWFNQPSFTISFWVNPDSVQHSGAIFDLQNDLSLYTNPNINTNYILAHLMQQDLLPNKWQHITITEDTGTRKLYVNGQLVQTNHWTYAPVAGHHLVLGNGGVYASAYWKGLIDEVKVYDHVLTDAEILTDVNHTLTGNEPGLLAYWNFDDEVCSGVSIDKTSNARVGTLTNVQRVPSTVPNLGQQVIPNTGGNTGTVTITINGAFFEHGAHVKLSKAGSMDITATAVSISNDGGTAQCVLDLAGKDTGVYNVSVINPDTTVKFYPNAFTVIPGTPADVWVNITGSNVIRQQHDFTFLVSYGNNGNIDARGVPLWVAIKGDSSASMKMNFTEKGNPAYASTLTFDSIPKYYLADSFAGQAGQFLIAPLYLPVIAPHTSGVLSFTIRSGNNIEIQAIVGQPLIVGGTTTTNVSLCIGSIIAAHAHDILNNLVPNDSCFVAAFDSLSAIPAFSGIGSLLYNMATAVRLCAGPNVPANTLANMAQQIYNTVVASGANTPCAEVFLHNGVDIFVNQISSYDPNVKTGPAKYTTSKQPYTYSIHFENLATASAPAQEVAVIDTLDKTKFDLSTFSFGVVSWGDSIYGTTYPYQKTFSVDINRVVQDSLVVRVQGYLDTVSGVLRWKFESLDPSTLDLTTNAARGFLPPNITSPQGEGFVTFDVNLLPGATTPTTVTNHATIVFDYNPSITTNTYTNVVDDVKPHSQVTVPATTPDTTLQIAWNGTDVGSGIKYYDIYMKQDTFSYELLKLHTADVSTSMVGKVGSTYNFYSIATDSAGNIQDDTIFARTSIVTGIPELDKQDAYLKQNTPNPYSGVTSIEFYLPTANNATLEIKDIYGRRVATIINRQLSSGWHQQAFDSGNLSAGIYLYQLTVNGQTVTKRMVVE